MHEAARNVIRQRMERTAGALRKNNMEAVCVDSAADVLPLLEQWIAPGSSVGMGGSVTLAECGVEQFLHSGRVKFLDRAAPGLTEEEKDAVLRAHFSADWFLCSANAITDEGEIFNVDGLANRIAALAFGPRNVALVAGCNKLVKDLAEAQHRLETLAAPANAQRLACKTPCAQTGVCANCQSPARICCDYLVLRQQRQKGRIRVILVAETLGF